MEAKLARLENRIGYEPYYNWVRRYWTARGKSLDFYYHNYLIPIYRDQHPHLTIMKSAQTGATERFITEAIWLPDQFRENSIYLFPTGGTISDLVQERIQEPMNSSEYLRIASSNYYSDSNKKVDKVSLKRMSKGFAYFRGANSPTQITSIAGDAIFVDEVDRMIQENIPFFTKRLAHSSRAWQRWASTPTIPNFGIHDLFNQTDQRSYLLKCNSCGTWQELEFDKNVSYELNEGECANATLICEKCKKEIVPWKSKGEWVAKFPSKTKRGYFLSGLYSPLVALREMVDESLQSAEYKVQQFYNQVLGVPYESSGSKITNEDIKGCVDDYKMPFIPEERIFVGIDVGKKLHYIVRTRNKIIDIGSVLDFFGNRDCLEAIIRKYKPSGVVIDALPETRKAQELCGKFPRMKICYYSSLEITKSNKYWKVSEEKVNTDRTVSLDMVFAEFKENKISLPKNYDADPEFVSHLKSTNRVMYQDNKGDQKIQYVPTSDDHLLHAANYAKLASEVFNTVTPEIFTV